MKIKIIHSPVNQIFLKINPTVVVFPSGFSEITHLIEEEDWDNFIKTFTRKKASVSFIKSNLKEYLLKKKIKQINNE